MAKTIILFIVFTILCSCSKTNQNNHDQIIKQTQYKVDSIYVIKNNLIQRLDTIYKDREKIKIIYETTSTVIQSNTPSEDFEFFTKYIERYDSIHNVSSIKAN